MHVSRFGYQFSFLAILILSTIFGCMVSNEVELMDRRDAIPINACKVYPENDALPPILHSDEFQEPVPMSDRINTAGGEDSPFIMPDGLTFYFWFTPNVSVPVEDQLADGVTGIYVSHKENREWSEPKRVILNDDISLDGCPFVLEDRMWFCSARPGYTGMHWFTARKRGGKWRDWEEVDFNPDHEVGELHITANGSGLYYHSDRQGGKGKNDLWVSTKVDGEWKEPRNLESLNSEHDDSRPFVSQDGKEMWFTRTHKGSPAVFRSFKVEGEWQEPELIVSQFAAEPTLDDQGNLYFVHHFIEGGKMIEADIYVARRK